MQEGTTTQWGDSMTFGEIFTFQKAVKNDRKSNSTIFSIRNILFHANIPISFVFMRI